jgi:trigger factor
MQRELKGLIASKLKAQVFDRLLENNPIDAPRKLIEDEAQTLKAQPAHHEQTQAELEELAARRVKLGVIVSEVARQNQIQIDPSRVREMVETIAASYEKPDEVIQWYYGNQEMLHGVQSTVIEEQVVEWIIEHGGVAVEDTSMSFGELVEEARQTQGK